MPFYSYECSGCGETAELFRKIAERDDHTDCIECGSKLERVFTPISKPYFVARMIYNVGPEPVFVTGAKELDNLCKKHESYIDKQDNFKYKRYKEKRREWSNQAQERKGIECQNRAR